MEEFLKNEVEKSAFGVCSYLGEKIGVASTKVRMYFIYTSFIAVGSPLIIYLFLAFWINIKNYVRNKRSLIWE
ncbi:MAG: PspC family transcriptional regulator [Saprospiraceae bacterium]